MVAPKVFVSYSRKDREITQRLVADLQQAGAEVWVDVDGIQSGNFMQAIDQALAACDWMVLVLSVSALESNYVSQETYTALHRVQQGLMKAVIPLLVTPCTPGSIPPQWDVLQRYDATQDYTAALAGVVRAVGLTPTPSGKAPPLTPAAASPKTITLPPSQFPDLLAGLGFTARTDTRDGQQAAYLLPPLCAVPAGPFLMGSDPKRDPVAAKESWAKDEQLQLTVTLTAFEIARYPVTVAEYACFVRSNHPESKDWQTQLGKLDHPVVNVTWHDAVAFAAWLSERTGDSFRLATEAEWEKAARGTDGRIYPWGDTFDASKCNTSESGIGTTTPVGNYPTGASLYGTQDVAGNVWEWTGSLYKPYPYNEADGRNDQESTDNRVLRGGSWLDDARGARPAYRVRTQSVYFNHSVGFRVVRVVPSS